MSEDPGRVLIRTAVPEGFHLLSESGNVTEIARLVASWAIPRQAADRLTQALRVVSEISPSEDGRTVWALVRLPQSGRVDALLTLDVHVVNASESIDSLEHELKRQAASRGSDIAGRTSERRSTPLGEALLVHDLEFAPARGGSPRTATERAFVALFVGSSLLLSYRLLTQDLAAFDNLPGYLADLVSLTSLEGVVA